MIQAQQLLVALLPLAQRRDEGTFNQCQEEFLKFKEATRDFKHFGDTIVLDSMEKLRTSEFRAETKVDEQNKRRGLNGEASVAYGFLPWKKNK